MTAKTARQGENQGNGIWPPQNQGKPIILEFGEDEIKWGKFQAGALSAQWHPA